MRKRDNGHVSIAECPYPEVDDPLSSPAQSPSINSVPPSAMAAAAAAAGVDAVSSIGSLESDDSSILAGSSAAGLGPPTFGSSFVSDDDPYAWAQKLRRIPDKVCPPSLPPLPPFSLMPPLLPSPPFPPLQLVIIFSCAGW